MRWTVLVLAVALVGCANPLEPQPAPDTVRFVDREPTSALPAEYAGWYAEVEACVQRSGAFQRVAWFEADSIFRPDGTEHIGHVSRPDTITMIRPYVSERWAVKVYMIRQIMQTDSIQFEHNERAICWG